MFASYCWKAKSRHRPREQKLTCSHWPKQEWISTPSTASAPKAPQCPGSPQQTTLKDNMKTTPKSILLFFQLNQTSAAVLKMLFLDWLVKHTPWDINYLLSSPSSCHTPFNNLHIYPGSSSPCPWRKTSPLLKTNGYKYFWRKWWYSLLQNQSVVWGAHKHKERKEERLPGCSSGLTSGHRSSSLGRPPEPVLGGRSERHLCPYQGKTQQIGLTRLAEISFPSQIARWPFCRLEGFLPKIYCRELVRVGFVL